MRNDAPRMYRISYSMRVHFYAYIDLSEMYGNVTLIIRHFTSLAGYRYPHQFLILFSWMYLWHYVSKINKVIVYLYLARTRQGKEMFEIS